MAQLPFSNQLNVTFIGTMVVPGHGRAVVTATGMNTNLAKSPVHCSRSTWTDSFAGQPRSTQSHAGGRRSRHCLVRLPDSSRRPAIGPIDVANSVQHGGRNRPRRAPSRGDRASPSAGDDVQTERLDSTTPRGRTLGSVRSFAATNRHTHPESDDGHDSGRGRRQATYRNGPQPETSMKVCGCVIRQLPLQ